MEIGGRLLVAILVAFLVLLVADTSCAGIVPTVVCPNGKEECYTGNTCCPADSTKDKYICCPLSSAVCCSDYLHCCPQGYSCGDNGDCYFYPPAYFKKEKKAQLAR